MCGQTLLQDARVFPFVASDYKDATDWRLLDCAAMFIDRVADKQNAPCCICFLGRRCASLPFSKFSISWSSYANAWILCLLGGSDDAMMIVDWEHCDKACMPCADVQSISKRCCA